MSIKLNHTIVHSIDPDAAAEFFAGVFGLPRPKSFGPFLDVELGNEVTLVWGEEGGGSAKPVVERHVQAELRAIVSPAPYAETIRTSYGGESRRKRSAAV